MTDIGRRQSQRGFTLVEIMISIAVLSMISLAMVTAMRTLANTQESLTRTTDRVDEMRQVSQFLRQSLQQAQGGGGASGGLNIWWAAGGSSNSGLLLGEADEIIWTAPLDSIQGRSGMTYIRLYKEGNQLKLQLLPESEGIPEMQYYPWDQAGEGYLLVSEVDEFAITYRPQRGGPWVERLETGSGMPQTIGLSIKARGRYWSEIVVSPYGASE